MAYHFRCILFSAAALVACLCVAAQSRADSVVDYVLERGTEGRGAEHRQALIKNGRVYVKGADGSPDTDLLFDRNSRTVWLIDHPKRRFYQVNEQTLLQWSRQSRVLADTAANVALQFNLELPPEWTRPAPGPALRYVARGEKTVNTIPCRRYDIVRGNQKSGEICMGDGARLPIHRDDAETLLALKQFILRASHDSADLIAAFGIDLPQLGSADMPGIPVEVYAPAMADVRRIHLAKAAPAAVDPGAVSVPQGYMASDLPLPAMP